VARLALDERVDELLEMPGRLPDLRREDDGGVDADDVVAGLHHRAPPLSTDVLLQLDAERTVVPGRAGAAVDLRRRVDETPALRQADEVFDAGGGVFRGSHGGCCSIRLGVGEEGHNLSPNLSSVPMRRGPVDRRWAILLVVAVGVVFLVGLAVHGPVGGVLLLLVAATLVLFSSVAWWRVRPQGRALRILVLAAVVVLAVAKLAGKT
jgi:hypothetical protein